MCRLLHGARCVFAVEQCVLFGDCLMGAGCRMLLVVLVRVVWCYLFVVR